jgi:low temperature requirement protein LtrA
MRVAMLTQWLRAARRDVQRRATCRRYVGGTAAVQVFWVLRLLLPPGWGIVGFFVLVAAELLVPWWAERAHGTAWHPHHIAERYGLFTIIVLGESVAAAVTGLHDGGWKAPVVTAAGFAVVVAACLWWVYFDLAGGAAKRELVEEGEGTRQGVHDVYTYLHLPIAVSLAAVAVGLEHVVLHAAEDHVSIGTRWILGIGLAGYLVSCAVIQAAMSGGARGPLLWPGAGVPAVALLVWLDPRPALLLGLIGAVLITGLLVGIAEHRAGWVRTAKV